MPEAASVWRDTRHSGQPGMYGVSVESGGATRTQEPWPMQIDSTQTIAWVLAAVIKLRVGCDTDERPLVRRLSRH